MNNRYLKRVVGRPLSECIAELTLKMPNDPIDFIAKWLYRYMDNELYFYEKKHMMASMRKMQLDIRRQRELRQWNIDQLNQEIKDVILELRENALEMRKLLNQLVHRPKQHIIVEQHTQQLILPQIMVKKPPKKEKARSYASVASAITGITGITTISSSTLTYKSSGQVEMSASSKHTSETDLVVDMQKRFDSLGFVERRREKVEMAGKMGALLRLQDQRQRGHRVPSMSGRKDQERRQREAFQRLATRPQREKRHPDDHDHRHPIRISDGPVPAVPQDLDMYEDEEYPESPRPDPLREYEQSDYHSKDSLREHIHRVKDSQSDFYSDQERTARPKVHRERKHLDKQQLDDSPEFRERGRRHRHKDTDREQLDDSAEFRERGRRHRHKDTEKELTDGPLEHRERRHRRKKSPEDQRDEDRDYVTEDKETDMGPRSMGKHSRQRISRIPRESAVKWHRHDQQKQKYPDAHRRQKKPSDESQREDIEESLSSSSGSSSEILHTPTRGGSGTSTSSRSRRAFIRKHGLGALVNENDDEVVEIMRDPELLENLKRLKRIMGSASWTVDCNLGLVCNHSILGLLKGRPPFVPPETPEWWERQGYLSEAFYDHEIYTCDNSDVHELLSIITPNMALSYSDFQIRVSGQEGASGSIGHMTASQRSRYLKHLTSKSKSSKTEKRKTSITYPEIE